MSKPEFVLRKPNTGRRKRFSIMKRQKIEGKWKTETIKNKKIDSINTMFLKGALDFASAERQLRAVIDSLYREIGIRKLKFTTHKDNLKLFEKYWDDQYAHRILEDEDSAKFELLRAINAIGDNSLYTASASELSRELKKRFSGDRNKWRRIVSKLNQLLKYIKRTDVLLYFPKKERKAVKYITENELKKVILFIDDDLTRTLVNVLFYSGVRLSEAFSIDETTPISNYRYLYIDSQITEHGTSKPTKNDKIRNAYFFKDGVSFLKKWISSEKTFDVGRTALLKRFKRACEKAFPKNPSKWLCLHDLRHSYAKMLFSRGVSTSLVAQSIGDSVRVCEDHYLGWDVSEETIELIDTLVRRNSK